MKKILFFVSLFWVAGVWAEGNACKDYLQNSEGRTPPQDKFTDLLNTVKNEPTDNPPFSPRISWHECKQIFNLDKEPEKIELAQSHFEKALNNSEIMSRINENAGPAAAVNNGEESCKRIIRMEMQCLAVVKLIKMNDRKWTQENITPQSLPARKDNPRVSTQNNQLVVTQSTPVNCVSDGIMTLDYDNCDTFSTLAENLEVAQMALQAGQNLYYQGKAMDHSLEAQKNLAKDSTAALKAQKDGFKDQQQMYTNNTAIDAAKGTALAYQYYKMPTMNTLEDDCKQIDQNNVIQTDLKLQNACKSALVNMGSSLIKNKDAREKMMKKLVETGASAFTNLALSEMSRSRASQVNGAIANINNFQPSATAGLDDALNATYCQLNPNDTAKCQNNLSTQFSTIGDSIVDFSNNGTGTVYSGNSTDGTTASSGSSDNTTTGAKANAANVIGSAIVDNRGSDTMQTAAGASISKGGGANSPGGGGAAGGAAGGGGLAGANPTKPQEGGVVQAAAGGKSPNYSGGGGSLSIMGGLGINKGKPAAGENANPFSNMFGDKAKVAGTDKVVNFRGPASVSDTKGNLFDIISKRYNNVTSTKRLLEYEEVK